MDKELQKQNLEQGGKVETVSPAVIKRLPRYFRYLRELIREGTMRISSGELAARMNVTASQIRQDLNCFGGFGQQGYGYNVQYLYTKISELLGVGEGYSAVIVGAGNLGRALIRNSMFEKRGVDVIAAFDVDPQQVGRVIADVTVLPMSEVAAFCRKHQVDIAVLTLPKEHAAQVAHTLAEAGVRAFWNFTSTELQDLEPTCTVETVHLGDSLMTLCYRLRSNGEDA
jgi:redox-sensing transcriptional repressor